MLLVSPATVASEVERTDQQIRQAGFTDEILFRPPYGKKLFTLPWYLSRQQRKTIMWDLEPESEPKLAADPQAMAAAVIAKARPGSIILLHVMYQSRQSSREALPLIIEGLQAKGYRFVTVNELITMRASK
jgi:peptidoglycan/xylan/chitin deacetylase (PgdA/CDA1 family)